MQRNTETLTNPKMNEFPFSTDFTRIIKITAYDAKMFLTQIQCQIEVCLIVNKENEAKHWQSLLESATNLFNKESEVSNG